MMPAPHPRPGRLANLAALLRPPPRLYRQRRDGVDLPDAGRGPRWWILSRGLCRFHRIPLAPGGSRQSLTLAMARLSPFEETATHLHTGDRFVTAWLWDQGAAFAAAREAGLDPRQLRFLPETVLLPPQPEGLRLVETMDGVEAQYWNDGSLVASRWWAEPPDDQAWLLFQRGGSLPPDRLSAVPPRPLQLAWLERPWTRPRPGAKLALGRVDARLAAAALALPALVALGIQAGQAMRLSHDIGVLEREVAARSEDVRPILDARSRALDNLAAIRLWRDVDPYPGQLRLMALVARKLPANETHFTDWSFDRGQLEVTLAANRPLDTLSFVRGFEGADGFRNVTVERVGSDNALRIRLMVPTKW